MTATMNMSYAEKAMNDFAHFGYTGARQIILSVSDNGEAVEGRVSPFSADVCNISSVAEESPKVKVGKYFAKRVEAVAITKHVVVMLSKCPALLRKLLLEIQETFPKLRSVHLYIPQNIPAMARFLSILQKDLLEPLMSGAPFSLSWRKQDHTCAVRIFMHRNKFADHPNQHVFQEGEFMRAESLYRPLFQLLAQLPNLQTFENGNSIHSVSMLEIHKNTNLKSLFWSGCNTQEGSKRFDLCVHLSVQQLGCALQNTNACLGKRKRRKCFGDMSGCLKQLETVVIRDAILYSSSILPFSRAMQKNNSIYHFEMKYDLHEECDVHPEMSTADYTQAQLWDPFLEILRHNTTLKTMKVAYLPSWDEVAEGDHQARYSPYLKEKLLAILTEHNHTISSVSFRELDRSSPSEQRNKALLHPEEIQYRLGLNHFGLAGFAPASNNPTAHMSTGDEGPAFSMALVVAVEKEASESQEPPSRLIPCLFQLFTNDPRLLINALGC